MNISTIQIRDDHDNVIAVLGPNGLILGDLTAADEALAIFLKLIPQRPALTFEQHRTIIYDHLAAHSNWMTGTCYEHARRIVKKFIRAEKEAR